MTVIAGHLSVEALRERYVSSTDAREARHFQTIWLLAKGHSTGEVAEMTSFGQRWIEQLIVRYNAKGPEALGDLRRGNGAATRVPSTGITAYADLDTARSVRVTRGTISEGQEFA